MKGGPVKPLFDPFEFVWSIAAAQALDAYGLDGLHIDPNGDILIRLTEPQHEDEENEQRTEAAGKSE